MLDTSCGHTENVYRLERAYGCIGEIGKVLGEEQTDIKNAGTIILRLLEMAHLSSRSVGKYLFAWLRLPHVAWSDS